MFRRFINYFQHIYPTDLNSEILTEEDTDDINTPITLLTEKQTKQRSRSFDEKYNNIHVCDDNLFDEECSICLENICINDIYKKLNCGHIYHKTCIKNWIVYKNKQTCPLCNTLVNGMNEFIIKG